MFVEGAGRTFCKGGITGGEKKDNDVTPCRYLALFSSLEILQARLCLCISDHRSARVLLYHSPSLPRSPRPHLFPHAVLVNYRTLCSSLFSASFRAAHKNIYIVPVHLKEYFANLKKVPNKGKLPTQKALKDF